MRFKAFPRLAVAPKAPDFGPPARLSDDIRTEEALAGVRVALYEQGKKLNDYAKELQSWQEQLRNSLVNREDDIDRVLNGGVQFAKPFSKESNRGANIQMVFRHFFLDNAVTSKSAICIDPLFGDGQTPPRGWIVVQIQEIGAVQNSRPILILDQILSSTNPDPSVAGYSAARVDATDSKLIHGDALLAPAGWTGNDIRVDDEISLVTTFTGAGTISTTAGSADVVGVGTNFTELVQFDYIRLTGVAGFEEWKQVIRVVDATRLTVNDAFRTTIAGATYEEKIADDQWLRIVAVTLGVLTEDTLTLDPSGPGTQVPLGQTGVQYVIRRPPTVRKLWIRVLSESPNPVCATLGIF